MFFLASIVTSAFGAQSIDYFDNTNSVKSPAFLKETRSVFVPRSWFKSAVNLAIEEQVSQVVESRNTSSPKTKHPSWIYGSFAKLQRVSVLEIRTAF